MYLKASLETGCVWIGLGRSMKELFSWFLMQTARNRQARIITGKQPEGCQTRETKMQMYALNSELTRNERVHGHLWPYYPVTCDPILPGHLRP